MSETTGEEPELSPLEKEIKDLAWRGGNNQGSADRARWFAGVAGGCALVGFSLGAFDIMDGKLDIVSPAGLVVAGGAAGASIAYGRQSIIRQKRANRMLDARLDLSQQLARIEANALEPPTAHDNPGQFNLGRLDLPEGETERLTWLATRIDDALQLRGVNFDQLPRLKPGTSDQPPQPDA